MSDESGNGHGLLTRIARLEGQVELLTKLLIPVQPSKAFAAAATLPTLPPKVSTAINAAARGNRALERHLQRVAVDLVSQELDEDAIAKRIREGDRVD